MIISSCKVGNRWLFGEIFARQILKHVAVSQTTISVEEWPSIPMRNGQKIILELQGSKRPLKALGSTHYADGCPTSFRKGMGSQFGVVVKVPG